MITNLGRKVNSLREWGWGYLSRKISRAEFTGRISPRRYSFGSKGEVHKGRKIFLVRQNIY